MYERQDGNRASRSAPTRTARSSTTPRTSPPSRRLSLSPTEFPFTQEDFTLQMEQALELMPSIVGDESVGIKHAINGILSLTPDGMPILGELPEVKGLWSAAAVWIKEGPGVGKSLAEWMVHGESHIDLHSSDAARFWEHQKTSAHVKARTAEGFNKTYGIVHPLEQWASNRDVRLSPFHEREQELGAVFFEAAGWERPQWYESNAPLLEEYGDRVGRREAEWDTRWWSPIINAEHLAMRDRAGIFDLSAFAVFDVSGPGALDGAADASRCASGRRRGSGRSTRRGCRRAAASSPTSRSCGSASEHFRVVTGGAHGMADHKWLADHLPADGSAQIADLTSAWSTLGLWGPRARDILASRDERRRLERGLPVRDLPDDRDRAGARARVADLVRRRPRLGAVRPDRAGRARCGTCVWEAGARTASFPCGIGVYGTTGRLEKCYRAFGAELESEYTVVEADMAWGKVKEQDFVGKEAYVRHRDEEPVTMLCTLTVDDHTSSSGVEALPDGARADPYPRRPSAHGRKGSPLVRHERRRRAVGRQARAHGLRAAGAGERWGGAAPSSTWASSTRSRSTSSARRRSSTRRTRGSAHEGPHLREARPDDRRKDRPHARTRRRSRRSTSASRSARTRSAASRRRCA